MDNSSSSFTELNQAISMNNHGVDLLERGSFVQALQVLNQASLCYAQCLSTYGSTGESNLPRNPLVTALEMAIRSTHETKNNNEGKESCSSSLAFDYEWVDLKSTFLCKEPQLASSSDIGRNHKLSHFKANETSALPFLCLSGVKIQYDDIILWMLADQDLNIKMDLDNMTDDDDYYYDMVAGRANQIACEMIQWPIRFNLAIVNHIMGVQMGDCGRVFLERAHHSYTLAQLSVPETSFHNVFRLLLSTQNNQMSIYQEFSMPHDLKACLRILTDLMLTLPQYAERLDLDHEILLNLMVLSRTETAGAA